MSDLGDFLAGKAVEANSREKFVKRCMICTNPTLAAEVREYADGRIAGNIQLSTWKVWREYFQPKYNIGCAFTIERHIVMHLGLRLPPQ